MIKNIIFDLGGVLIDLDKQRCLDSFAAIGFDATPYLGRYEQKGLFRELELGNIDDQVFLDGINCPATDRQKAEAWTDFLVALPEHRKQAILELRKKGFNTYLLSNTNSIDWEYAKKRFFDTNGCTVNDYFIQVFLSFQMHIMKPDPAIFQQALTQAGLKAEETLFIDDSQSNCQAAESVGIKTICASGDDWIELLAQNL